MKVSAIHSKEALAFDVYHDNAECILAARIAPEHRAAGVAGRTWCITCAALD